MEGSDSKDYIVKLILIHTCWYPSLLNTRRNKSRPHDWIFLTTCQVITERHTNNLVNKVYYILMPYLNIQVHYKNLGFRDVLSCFGHMSRQQSVPFFHLLIHEDEAQVKVKREGNI